MANMRNKLLGIKEATFIQTLLVVVPPAIIGFLSANIINLQKLILLIIIVALWDISANVLNNYADWHTDELNKKRLMMHKYVSRTELLAMYCVFALVSFLIAFFYLQPKIYFYAFYFVEVLLAIWYSMHIKLKDKFIVNYAAIALAYGLFSFLMGFFALNSSFYRLINFLSVGIFLSLLYFGISIVKDYGDVKGDAANNRKTLPVIIGFDKTLKLQYVIITAAYIFLLIFVILGLLNIVFISVFLLYFSLIYMLSKINKTSEAESMRKIALYTKINTLILDILIIFLLLLIR